MQHEEVMIAKNKYHRYKERVDDEIASPEVSILRASYLIYLV